MAYKFLFWNINSKPLEHLVAQLVHERDVDVVLLAECQNSYTVLEKLNEAVVWQYNYHTNLTPVNKIEVFSRFPSNRIQSLGDYGSLNFRRITPPVGKDILLVGVHLPS